MQFPYVPNRHAREVAIVGDVVSFHTATVTCESAPAGSALAEHPEVAGRAAALDAEGVYSFVLGVMGEPGWLRVAVRVLHPSVEQWPPFVLSVNGASQARRVLGAMYRELGDDSVSWPAGASKNPLPTINGECVNPAPYGAPPVSDTMAAPGARPRPDDALIILDEEGLS